MTDLQDFQFEILASDADTDGAVWGIGLAVSIDGDGGFTPTAGDWLTQDTTNTRRGVVGFGRDLPGAANWAWASHVNQSDDASALAAMDLLHSAWKNARQALEPGALAVVRYRLAGRVRRVYGRPRRWDAPPSNLILSGFVPITHDFQCVDGFTYDDASQTITMKYLSSSLVPFGWQFPTTFPLPTPAPQISGSDPHQAVVGGKERTYPIIRLNGPWTNPIITTDNWTLALTGGIAEGGWVEIDARPWRLTILDQDGASRADMLDRKTWLQDILLEPNSKPEFALGGTSEGGATCTVTWRNAYSSI